MPLFSSKFSYKKADARRRKPTEDNEFEEESDERDSDEHSGSSEEDDDEDNEHRRRNKGKSKLTKSKSTASLKKRQELSRHNNRRLVLQLNNQQNLSFDFNVKRGKWIDKNGDISTRSLSKSSSVVSNVENVSKQTAQQVAELNNKIAELSDEKAALEEENRLMKLKIEILMEMVTETTAELNLKDKPPKE